MQIRARIEHDKHAYSHVLSLSQCCYKVVEFHSDKVVQLNFKITKSNTLIDPMINNYSVTAHTHNMHTDSNSESLRQQHYQESCVQ